MVQWMYWFEDTMNVKKDMFWLLIPYIFLWMKFTFEMEKIPHQQKQHVYGMGISALSSTGYCKLCNGLYLATLIQAISDALNLHTACSHFKYFVKLVH